MTLANIYAPNKDDPNFFDTFFDRRSCFKYDDEVIGGDFNLVLDVKKDKKNGIARTHQNALEVVKDAMENMELCGVWRIFNPDCKRYIWRQRQPEIHCRLDLFLASQSILGISTHTDITPGFKTDHSLIALSLALHSNPRKNGFWKLNTSLLADNNFIHIETIKIAIHETANEYKDDKLVNPLLLWDMIKLKVREKSITYSASIKKAKVKKKRSWKKKLQCWRNDWTMLVAMIRQ